MFVFMSNARQLAHERGYSPAVVASRSGISLNTARIWMSDRPITQVNTGIVNKLMTAFDLEDWTELLEVVETDNELTDH